MNQNNNIGSMFPGAEHKLTRDKAKAILEQFPDCKVTGLIITNPQGYAAIIDQGLMRSLDKERMRDLMCGETVEEMRGNIMMTQYTIYDHPADYPDDYVVRQWHIVKGMDEPVAGFCISLPSLEHVRQCVPPGLTQTMRHPEDDPYILETWV